MGERDLSGLGAHAPDPECDVCRKLRAALLRALAGSDYDSLSEGQIGALAGHPLGGHYADLDACLDAAYREVDAAIGAAFEEALDQPGPWTERLADAVVQTSKRLEAMPGALAVYEAARSGPESLRRLQESNRRRYVRMLARRAPDVPEIHLEFLIGALYQAGQEQAQSPELDVGRLRSRARQIIAVLEPVAL
jgi:hypothetical protein